MPHSQSAMDWHGAQGCHTATGKGVNLSPKLVSWHTLADLCHDCVLCVKANGSSPGKRVIVHLFLPGTNIHIDVENVKAAGVICVLGISFGIGTYVLYKIYDNFIKPKFCKKPRQFSDEIKQSDNTDEECCHQSTDEGKMGNDHSIADIPVYYKPGHGVSIYKPSEKVPIIPSSGAELRNRRSTRTACVAKVTNDLLSESLKQDYNAENLESVPNRVHPDFSENGIGVPDLKELYVDVDEFGFLKSGGDIEVDDDKEYSEVISSSLKGNFSPRSLFEKSHNFQSPNRASENEDSSSVFFPSDKHQSSPKVDTNENSKKVDGLNLANTYQSSSVLMTPPSEDESSSSEKLIPGSSQFSYHTTKSDVSDIHSEVASIPSENVHADIEQSGSGIQTDDEADNLSPLPYDKPVDKSPEKHFKKKLALRLNEISLRKNLSTASTNSSTRSSTPDYYVDNQRRHSVDRPESLSGISSPELDFLHSESTESPIVADTFEIIEDEIHEVTDEFEMISSKLHELTSRYATMDDHAGLAIVDGILNRYPSIRVRQKSLNTLLSNRSSSVSQNESHSSSNYNSDVEPELSWDLENLLDMVYSENSDHNNPLATETTERTETKEVEKETKPLDSMGSSYMTDTMFNSAVEIDGSLYEDDFHFQLGDRVGNENSSLEIPVDVDQMSISQEDIDIKVVTSPEQVLSPVESSISVSNEDVLSESSKQSDSLPNDSSETVEVIDKDVAHVDVLQPKRVCNIGCKLVISEYAATEWKGNTATAATIKQGYEEVPKRCDCCHLRQIRGDNYCGIRGVVFQFLVNKLPLCHFLSSVEQTLEHLTHAFNTDSSGLKMWNFANRISFEPNKLLQVIHNCVQTLHSKITEIQLIENAAAREDHVTNLLNSDPSCDLELMEGVKLLMLLSAVALHRDIQQGNDVPVFAWLLFARDTSETLRDFVRNHLNPVGGMSGLEQVEMFLLGYALGVRVQVFRLLQFGQDDFVSYYPDDCQKNWPTISLIAEDDRHYNVPVL